MTNEELWPPTIESIKKWVRVELGYGEGLSKAILKSCDIEEWEYRIVGDLEYPGRDLRWGFSYATYAIDYLIDELKSDFEQGWVFLEIPFDRPGRPGGVFECNPPIWDGDEGYVYSDLAASRDDLETLLEEHPSEVLYNATLLRDIPDLNDNPANWIGAEGSNVMGIILGVYHGEAFIYIKRPGGR